MRQRPLLLLLLLLAACLAPPAAPVRTAQPITAATSALGVNSNIASRYPTYETLRVPVAAVGELGAGWAREDFQFSRIQPEPGRFDWNWHDRVVDDLVARGVEVIGILNGPSPGWASGQNRAAFAPPDPAAFARFAQLAAERYRGRVRFWQVWNEPDNPSYWSPRPDPAAYAALLRAAAQAIRAANPDARILSAGLVAPQPAVGFLQQLHASGAWDAFDIIAIHPYTDPLGPEEGQIGVAGVGAVRGLADRLGPKPIWATEFGWSTGPADRLIGRGAPVDEATQADYLVRGTALLRAAGVERVLWYNLKDTQERDGSPFNQYGLLRYDPGRSGYGPELAKPAFRAFQVMSAELAGTGAAAPLDLSPRTAVLDFEDLAGWRRQGEPNGSLTGSGEEVRGGATSGRLDYSFRTPRNDYVAFTPPAPLPLPDAASSLGLWVYGDGSSHALNVQLRDRQGELLQFRLGPVGGAGWQFVSTPLGGEVARGNVIANPQNRRLDLPAALVALVLDDDPDSAAGAGTIYLDDLTAAVGPEVYGVRFPRGGEVVDVVWAPAPAQVAIPTRSAQVRRVQRGGEVAVEAARDGQYTFRVGPAPVYLHHTPGEAAAAAPAGGGERCFTETGQCIAGPIRAYWERNGGLAVFGLPITAQAEETVEGRQLQAQWFERDRLEIQADGAVTAGRLGVERLQQLGTPWERGTGAPARAGCLAFTETGYDVCGAFRTYWERNGGLQRFGYPVTAQFTVTLEGQPYTVQYFERRRFELHPEIGPDAILLGLLGREVREHEPGP